MNPTRIASFVFAVVFLTATSWAQENGAGGTGDGPAIDVTCVGMMAPAVAHVRAAPLQMDGVSPIDTRYEWDFGDPGSKYNQLPGWNTAHVYEQPGKYTITLTVRLPTGQELKRTTWVRIAPDERKKIYVSSEGNDQLDGRSAGRAVRTAARAFQLAGSESWVLFRQGDVFDITKTIWLAGRGIRVGNYPRPGGDPTLFPDGVQLKPPPGVAVPPPPPAPRPTLPVLRKVAGPPKEDTMLMVGRNCEDLLIQGVEFDSIWGLKSQYGSKPVPARAFTVGGTNIAIRWCSFRNVTDAVAAELRPTGLLVADSDFSKEIRAYGIYSVGSDHVYLGNVMRDSKNEHLIRASEPGISRVLVAYNDLRRPTKFKGSIEFRHASWFYVAGNYMNNGLLRVGPQEQDKAATPNWAQIKCEWGVIQDNRLDDIFLNVRLGTYHLAFRNNVIRQKDEDWAIIIACEKPGYDDVRKAGDIRIAHNTVINEGTRGMFIFVQGRPQGLTLQQNVFIAPNIKPGPSNASIYATRGLEGIDKIEGNVFPTSAGTQHRVGGQAIDKTAWQKQPMVKSERYGQPAFDEDDNVPLDTNAGAKLGGDKKQRLAN